MTNHHYLCKEKYRLELHWKRLDYRGDSSALLKGAYLCGPVLRDAAKLEASDFIDLDLTPQLLTVFDSYYIVRLSWGGVDYRSDGSVVLLAASLKSEYLKHLHKFEGGDYILIDTSKHEEETHAYHLVYESQIMRSTKEPYSY